MWEARYGESRLALCKLECRVCLLWMSPVQMQIVILRPQKTVNGCRYVHGLCVNGGKVRVSACVWWKDYVIFKPTGFILSHRGFFPTAFSLEHPSYRFQFRAQVAHHHQRVGSTTREFHRGSSSLTFPTSSTTLLPFYIPKFQNCQHIYIAHVNNLAKKNKLLGCQ